MPSCHIQELHNLFFSCPKYTNIPSGCSEVKKAGDCCTTVQCGSGTFLSSTGNLGSIGNGGLINVGNGGVRPTIPTGGLAPPGTGGTIFQAPTLSKYYKIQAIYCSLSSVYVFKYNRTQIKRFS